MGKTKAFFFYFDFDMGACVVVQQHRVVMIHQPDIYNGVQICKWIWELWLRWGSGWLVGWVCILSQIWGRTIDRKVENIPSSTVKKKKKKNPPQPKKKKKKKKKS